MTTTLTAPDLARLADLHAASDHGEWGAQAAGHVGDWRSFTVTPQCTNRGGMTEANARYIVAAHHEFPQLLALAEEALRLRAAIAEHGAQVLDDRCWLDDAKLYAAAGVKADGALPPHDQFMQHCDHYSRCRRNGTAYEPRYFDTAEAVKARDAAENAERNAADWKRQCGELLQEREQARAKVSRLTSEMVRDRISVDIIVVGIRKKVAEQADEVARLRAALIALCDAAENSLRLSAYPPHSVASKEADDEALHAIHKARAALGAKT